MKTAYELRQKLSNFRKLHLKENYCKLIKILLKIKNIFFKYQKKKHLIGGILILSIFI